MKIIMTMIALISMSSFAQAGKARLAEEVIALNAGKTAANLSKDTAQTLKSALASTKLEAVRKAKQMARDIRNGNQYSGMFDTSKVISEGTLPDGSSYILELSSGVNSNDVVSSSFRLATTSENNDTLIALSKGISSRGGSGLRAVVEKENNGFVDLRSGPGTGVGFGYVEDNRGYNRVLTSSVDEEDLDLVISKLIKLESDINNKTLGKKIQLSRKVISSKGSR